MKPTITITFECETNLEEIPDDIKFMLVNAIFGLGACNACHLPDDIKDVLRTHHVRGISIVKPGDLA